WRRSQRFYPVCGGRWNQILLSAAALVKDALSDALASFTPILRKDLMDDLNGFCWRRLVSEDH
ncbi:hypothetical protein PMAYCL1PPCAC_27154, partial [Pristionchus mayeri]